MNVKGNEINFVTYLPFFVGLFCFFTHPVKTFWLNLQMRSKFYPNYQWILTSRTWQPMRIFIDIVLLISKSVGDCGISCFHSLLKMAAESLNLIDSAFFFPRHSSSGRRRPPKTFLGICMNLKNQALILKLRVNSNCELKTRKNMN